MPTPLGDTGLALSAYELTGVFWVSKQFAGVHSPLACNETCPPSVTYLSVSLERDEDLD